MGLYMYNNLYINIFYIYTYCKGDSGGPLYTRDSVNNITKYILSGITSYGDGCALAGKPG